MDVPLNLAGQACQVTVWNDTVSALDMGDAVAAWLDAFLAIPGRRLPRALRRTLPPSV